MNRAAGTVLLTAHRVSTVPSTDRAADPLGQHGGGGGSALIESSTVTLGGRS